MPEETPERTHVTLNDFQKSPFESMSEESIQRLCLLAHRMFQVYFKGNERSLTDFFNAIYMQGVRVGIKYGRVVEQGELTEEHVNTVLRSLDLMEFNLSQQYPGKRIQRPPAGRGVEDTFDRASE